MTMRHGDEEDMGHLLGNLPGDSQKAPEVQESPAPQPDPLISSESDAGPAATPRPDEPPTPLEQAIERTSRHQDTPGRPRRTMNAIDRLRAARIAWAAWREASDLLGNTGLPTWHEMAIDQKEQCCDLIEEMAAIPFGAARTRQAEIFQAIAYTVGE